MAGTEIVQSLAIPATDHLADAQLHLRRCLIEIRNAAQADPSLVVKLGTKHATLQDVLAALERGGS